MIENFKFGKRGEAVVRTDPKPLEDLEIGFLDWMEGRLANQIEDFLLRLGRDAGPFHMNEKLCEFVGTHVKRNYDFDEMVLCMKWNAKILKMMDRARESLGIVGEKERRDAVRSISNQIAVEFLEHIREAAGQKKAELALKPVEANPESLVHGFISFVRDVIGWEETGRKVQKEPVE